MKLKRFFLLTLLIGFSIWSVGQAKQAAMMTGHKIFTATDLKWVPAPPSLPPGAKIAVLEGNPMAAGPFTMRIMLPANYKVPPHSHPSDEHVTVISGELHLAMGSRFDETKGEALAPGSFALMRPGTRHYAWTTEETVIQLHGIGPWGIHYVNPKDDPRNHQ